MAITFSGVPNKCNTRLLIFVIFWVAMLLFGGGSLINFDQTFVWLPISQTKSRILRKNCLKIIVIEVEVGTFIWVGNIYFFFKNFKGLRLFEALELRWAEFVEVFV